jgi:hypothetical protein
MAFQKKPPQLVLDRGVPIWRATRAAIKAGFPTKRVNLKCFAHDAAALDARCHRLTAEQNEWLAGRRNRDIAFDGTIRAAINLWQIDPDSPYQLIEASSRHPYDIYARMIVQRVGERRIDVLDGRDLRRWHAEWSAPEVEGGRPMLAKARMAMIVLKNALTFATTCRKPGCAELRNIIGKLRFAGPRPREDAPTAAARNGPWRGRARLRVAIRRCDPTMGRGRQMAAARGQESIINHRWHVEMGRADVVADRWGHDHAVHARQDTVYFRRSRGSRSEDVADGYGGTGQGAGGGTPGSADRQPAHRLAVPQLVLR